MRWVTHQVGALGAAIWLQLPLAGLAAAWVGGILPDVFDQKLAGLFANRQKAFNRIHRGFTHWPGLWLALVFAAVLLVPREGEYLLRPVCVGLAVGGLSHVVPFSRRNRFSLKLCKTGSFGEYAFLATMIVCMWIFLREEVYSEAHRIVRTFWGA